MDGTTTYSCDTLVAGLVLQSTPVDWWCLYWIHGDTDPSIYTAPVNSESSHTDNPVRPPAPPAKTYILPKTSPCSLNLQVELTSLTSLTSITTSALLDSRATGMFINQDFVQRHRLETTPLPQPVLLHNVDGSANEHGSITEEVH